MATRKSKKQQGAIVAETQVTVGVVGNIHEVVLDEDKTLGEALRRCSIELGEEDDIRVNGNPLSDEEKKNPLVVTLKQGDIVYILEKIEGALVH